MKGTDIISPQAAHTLSGILIERVKRTPNAIGCRQYNEELEQWQSFSWQQINDLVMKWRGALAAEQLQPGDRVAIMLRNCKEWICFDLAALGLGLVTVPLYPNDRADNVAYILQHAGAKLLLLEDVSEQADLLQHEVSHNLQRVLSLKGTDKPLPLSNWQTVTEWLKGADSLPDTSAAIHPEALATIVYTSGTTGPPKGVMLSHNNILWNAWSGLHSVTVYPDDSFLSFLPLSHTLERTVGYYLPIMAGASIIYARSIPLLAEDLLDQKPSILISVPRIYERIYNRLQEQLANKRPLARYLFNLAVAIGWKFFEYQQHRGHWQPALLLQPLLNRLVGRKIQNRLGGQLRIAICGGAPLPEYVSKLFIALGLAILQGYGLTETSPIISVNKLDNNLPRSVGLPLQDVSLQFSEEGELLVKSPGIMLGYWQNPEATAQTIDERGWLHSGDLGKQDKEGYISITGRLKDIIVLANGEKVSPVDMETAITADNLIDQVLVIGDDRPFLSALLVLNDEAWGQLMELNSLTEREQLKSEPQLEQQLLHRIAQRLHDFPSYAQIIRIAISLHPWTIENGLSTPTLKAKRQQILTHFKPDIDRLYEGHQ